MSISSKIDGLTISRNAIRTKMVNAGQALSTDKLADLASKLDILDTSDATATSSDIIIGKSAYINGSKVMGSLDIATVGDIQSILNGSYGY